MLTIRHNQHGFSLVELLIGIAIIGILLAAAMPNFRTWMINAQTRNAAESFLNGLQHARAEAVARNTNVAFSFATDSSWTAYPVLSPASSIDSRSPHESTTNLTLTPTPAGATTVTFDSFGNVLASNTGSTINPNTGAVVPATPFTSITFSSAGGTRNLQINISVPGGNARMCDPTAAAHTPSAC